MSGLIERSYGRVFKTTLHAVNPIKKAVVRTECRVHRFINNQSIIILKNDGYINAYNLFKKHIDDLNSGVVWADQDLKNSNHFYNPQKNRGLYGFSNAFKECTVYYTSSLVWWKNRNIKKSMFYLGAACHLVQDVTVPQHVNIKLFKHHRQYERWVLRTYANEKSFRCFSNGIYLDNIKDYFDQNAEVALSAYNKNKEIINIEKRYFNITHIALCQAQRSTAGFLNMFYNAIEDIPLN
ncbi:MAG: zinc dependent phospholipase C family protein [Clostridiales bacterium]|nr:zinc dependent phospholipase C family protein [Clostridiales bacterium]